MTSTRPLYRYPWIQTLKNKAHQEHTALPMPRSKVGCMPVIDPVKKIRASELQRQTLKRVENQIGAKDEDECLSTWLVVQCELCIGTRISSDLK